MQMRSETVRRGLLCLLFYPLLHTHAQKQDFSIDALVDFTTVPAEKFSAFITRKGFRQQESAPSESQPPNVYLKVSKDKAIEQLIGRYEQSETASILYQTTSMEEFNDLIKSLKEDGYTYPSNFQEKENAFPLYQKANITIQPMVKQTGDKVVYCFQVEKKKLPKANAIAFAEDLLQLTSHAYLEAVYGASNVRKDLFYFSENEVNKCSVLFPNTSLQVIFIWKDETNSRDLAFIMIGGHLRAQSSMTYHKQIEMNKWRSAQGIYPGMSLKELYEINKKPIQFYGWETEEAGFILPDNKGNIDFKTLGVQLSCLDCNEDRYYSRNKIINSNDVLQENRRVYVSTIILLPGKK